jgi:hypothetical protein
VKDVQTAGYSRGGGAVDEGVTLNLGALAALDAVDFQTASGEPCYCFLWTQIYDPFNTRFMPLPIFNAEFLAHQKIFN